MFIIQERKWNRKPKNCEILKVYFFHIPYLIARLDGRVYTIDEKKLGLMESTSEVMKSLISLMGFIKIVMKLTFP